MKARGPRRADLGFTLVELLISITVMGLLLLALGAALMTTITVDQRTQTRLAGSQDIQFSANSFSKDVQNASVLAVSTAPTCGAATSVTGLLDLLTVSFDPSSLRTVTPTGAPIVAPTPVYTRVVVSYVRATAADGSLELRRRTCAATSSTALPAANQPVIDEVTVARSATAIAVACATAPAVSPAPTTALTSAPTATPTATPYATADSANCSSTGATVTFAITGRDGEITKLSANRRPA